MKEKMEYRLVTIVEDGRPKYKPKGDAERALKGLADALVDRDMRLDIFSEDSVAYRRSLNATFHIEVRDVSSWRKAETADV